MIIVGERINGQFKDVEKAIKEKDKKPVQQLALDQLEKGADFLDINVGTAVASSEKKEAMVWLIEAVQEVTDAPLALDSPIQAVIEASLETVKTPPMINSTQADPEKLERYINYSIKYDASLIALTMDKDGVPNDVQKRIELAGNIVMAAMEGGLPFDRLYIDPIILPVNAIQTQPGFVLEALRQLQGIADPNPHFILGLSNVSQNTRERSLINRTYLAMCVAMGMDAAIADPFDEELMKTVATSELLLNKQIYSDSYISAYFS